MSEDKQEDDPGNWVPKWHAGTTNVTNYTCVFPAITLVKMSAANNLQCVDIINGQKVAKSY